MESSEQLWAMLTWGLGSCLTGFLFLTGCILRINMKLSEKVSHNNFEEKIEKEVKSDMKDIVKLLGDIKDAVVGNFDHPGIITRTADAEKRIEHIEKDIHQIKQKVGA